MQPGCQKSKNQKNRSNSFNRIPLRVEIPRVFAAKTNQHRGWFFALKKEKLELH
jgi:hypothetical protein